MKTIGLYDVPCVGAFFESFERKAKGEAKPYWKTDQKSEHKALQRDIRRCFQNHKTKRSFWDQNPSSEASWAPPAAEKRPTRAPRGPRGAKTTQSERQERPKSVSRAIFSKIRPQGCGSQPSRTLCLLWQTEKVTGPRALKRRLLSHFAGAKRRVGPRAPASPPLRNPPMMLRKQQ